MNYLAIGIAITGFIILGAGIVSLVGWVEYQEDRNNHRGAFVSNDQVENFPWSLLPEDKK